MVAGPVGPEPAQLPTRDHAWAMQTMADFVADGRRLPRDWRVVSLDPRPDAVWRYQQLAGGNRQERLAADEWFWAWDEVDSIVTARPDEAIELLVQLSEAAESAADLEVLGAGPIENLIQEHLTLLGSPEGRTMVEQLVQVARHSASFRQALGSVWYDSDEIPSHVRDQILGFPIPRDCQG